MSRKTSPSQSPHTNEEWAIHLVSSIDLKLGVSEDSIPVSMDTDKLDSLNLREQTAILGRCHSRERPVCNPQLKIRVLAPGTLSLLSLALLWTSDAAAGEVLILHISPPWKDITPNTTLAWIRTVIRIIVIGPVHYQKTNSSSHL